MAKALRQTLEERAGFEECEFIVPHVFLPPRFKEISEDRNMLLILDRDCVVHVRWEGSRADPHHPLTPGEVRRLMKDVSRKMSKYRRDLNSFSSFLDKTAEVPFWDPREHSLTREREERDAPIDEGALNPIRCESASPPAEEDNATEIGGETPPELELFMW